MKRALLYIGIALAAIGCTKDVDVDVATPSGDNALTFTSNITSRADKSAWETTDHIGVYMTTGTTFGDGGENKDYAYKGSNSFASDDPLYLPSSGSVEIFAYYPYVNGVDLAAYTIDSGEQVDILSATNDDVSSSNVALQFDHLLSKVSLTIEAGDGVTLADLDALVVKISGIGTKTEGFNLTEPSAAVTFTESAELTFDTTITKVEDSVTAISSSAIVIPQELTTATPTLFFTTSGDDGKTYSATIPTDEFETGLEYTYTVTIKENTVEITSATIDTWEDGDAASGTADIVDIELKDDGIYYINSGAGLKAFADLVNGVENTSAISAGVTFSTTPETKIQGVLTRNIDLSDVCGADLNESAGVNWTPIGKTSTTMFAGTFNGGGYCVSGLYIGTGSKLGLFGYLDEDGLVYNVGVKGTITTTSAESAGIVSYNYGWVMNSYSEVTLNCGVNTAGIAGYNIGNVVNCYNRGNVTGTNNVGGIVGQNAAGGYVGYSFSVGDVSGTTRVGGVVGWNHTTTATAPTIKGCFCLDLDGDDYSIGQLEYVASSGSSTANMYDSDYLTSDVFAAIMNNGTYTYNLNEGTVHAENPYNIDACAWNDNSTSDYPTLNFGVVNTETKWIYDIVYNNETYEIYTAAGLQAFAALVNDGGIDEEDGYVTSGHFATYFESPNNSSYINGSLMKDIDLSTVCGATLGEDNSGINWTPIGTTIDASYSGTFNGNGKEVSNLYIYNTTGFQGLFGSSSGTISNLGVSVDITGGDSSIGGVIGYNSGTITNCYSSGNGVSSTNNSGGVVGWNTGSIINCYNSGSVSSGSGDNAGGIAGYNRVGTIINCYNSGKVSAGTESSVGGVVGYNYNNEGTITNCYWDSTVTGTATAGVGNETSDGVSNSEDMKATSFITLLNSNAYSYNTTNTPTVTACAWKEVTDGYPTLSFGTDPGITYSELSYFSESSYPAGNIWYITDTDAEGTADEASDFEGLEKALEVANTSGNITVIFSNLETLPDNAFKSCTYLTSISLPSATTIENHALRFCTALTSVSLPSATEIGEYAFCGSTSLTSIELPSVTTIGDNAFLSCTSLISATLPSATKIGATVFKSCGSLTSIELSSAESIGESAFSLCAKLTTLDLGSSGNGISSIGSGAFYKDTDATIAGDIDLTIKIASGSTTVFVGDDGKTLTYGNTGNSTATFKSITVITNYALND